MKRTLALGLIFSLILVLFSGCADKKLSDSQISGMLKEAFAKNEALENVYVKSYTEVSYDFGSTAYSIETESTIKESNIGDKDKYELSTDTTVKSLGSESSYETYFKDGYYYTSRYGGKFKTKMDLEDIDKSSSVSLVKVAFDDMKTVATKTVRETSSGEEGEFTYISFTCKNKVLKEYISESFNADGNAPDAISIGGSDGQYVINEEGYLVSERLSVSANITVDGEETESVVSVKTVFSDIGADVNPYDPEDSEYTKVDDLKDVIDLNDAIGSVITSDNVDMDMEITTEVVQDENKTGYKRTYFRKMSTADESYAQEVSTSYSDGKTFGDEYKSLQYFTDGTYYSGSDQTGIKLKCDLDFKEFYSTIYSSTSKSPASMYATGMMKNLKSEKSGDDTVYSFELNPKSEEGVSFLEMLFGPYDQFGGDCEAAETVINSFKAKSYVNSKGEYYKTVMECDLLIKFEEGDVAVKSEQTVNINSTNRDEIKFTFPKFKGYEEWDKADLLGAFS